MSRDIGRVYFVTDEVAIKIGYTVAGVKGRVSNIQTGHHADLRLIGSVSAADYPETSLLGRFSHLRIRGEWFRAAPELTTFIDGLREAGVLTEPTPPTIPEQLSSLGRIRKTIWRYAKARPDDPVVQSRCAILRGNLERLIAEPSDKQMRDLTLRNVKSYEQYLYQKILDAR